MKNVFVHFFHSMFDDETAPQRQWLHHPNKNFRNLVYLGSGAAQKIANKTDFRH